MTIKAVIFDAYGTLFNVNSVKTLCEQLFPGMGESISQIWRQKQLEYSWLRAVMNQYEDFWTITGDGLRYALEQLNLRYTEETIGKLREVYLNLELYPEVTSALQAFRPSQLFILSNGTQEMLQILAKNSGLSNIDGFLSVDAIKTYKPSQQVYEIALNHLMLRKEEVLFVSSNGWDAGAKWFGFTVGWVNRLNNPLEQLGVTPDYQVTNLLELAERVS